jgi:hypothetical protein
MSIYGFMFGLITILFNKEHPMETLQNILKINKKDKIKLYFVCFPISKITVISFIDLDPTIVTILNSIIIIFNFTFSSIVYNKKKLLTKINLAMIIINVFCCGLPFVFNDDFTIKFDKHTKIGIIGISSIIISILVTSAINVLSENIKNMEMFDVKNNYPIFTLSTFFIAEIIIYVLLIPVLYVLQQYVIQPINCDKYTKDFMFELISYGCLTSIIYGPLYVISTKAYLMLNAIDVGIIRNLSLVIITIINCLSGISQFYYLYIPSILGIIISSSYIIYSVNKINKS